MKLFRVYLFHFNEAEQYLLLRVSLPLIILEELMAIALIISTIHIKRSYFVTHFMIIGFIIHFRRRNCINPNRAKVALSER
jgi:hypothetical protein